MLSPAYIAAAEAAQQKFGMPASVILAQLLLESRGAEEMPPDSNNPFGVKASDGYPSVLAWTHEYTPGKGLVPELKNFRKYDSLSDAFEDHARLLATSPRYSGVRAMVADGVNDTSADAYANGLTHVYASAPDYGAKLVDLMREHNLYQYNKPLLQNPISSGGSRNAAPIPIGAQPSAAGPRADLSPSPESAGAIQGTPILAADDQPGPPWQPGAAFSDSRPSLQGALNAPPPTQGGVPAGLGDYLYGPGAPAAHAGPAPLGALALNARPPRPGGAQRAAAARRARRHGRGRRRSGLPGPGAGERRDPVAPARQTGGASDGAGQAREPHAGRCATGHGAERSIDGEEP
jgi:hypothetical protein